MHVFQITCSDCGKDYRLFNGEWKPTCDCILFKEINEIRKEAKFNW